MWKILLGNNKEKGQIFLEVLIAVLVVSIAFGFLLDIGFSSLKISSEIKKSSEANFLIKEALESLRAFRDGTDWEINGLGTIQTSQDYYLEVEGEENSFEWVLLQGEETIEIFTRKIIFDRVSRNPTTGDIEEDYNDSNNDPDTIKATAIVTWENKSQNVSTYLTNWR